MGFPMYNTGTNVTNARRNVAFNVNEGIRDLNMTCPTSNTASTRTSASGTGKTDVVTKLKTIPEGVKDEVAFFGYRFRRKLVATAWV